MESLNLIPAAVADLTAAVATPSNGPWLTLLVLFPALVALVIWLVPWARAQGRRIAFWSSVLEFAAFIVIACFFDWSTAGVTQLVESYQWIGPLGITWSVGVNGLGLVMLLLAGLLVPLVLLAAKNEDQDPVRGGGYAALIMALYSFIVVIFGAYDLVLFYIAFEAMLIPLFFMISRYGTGENPQRAAMKFLLYSLAGGLIMLGGLVVIGALGIGTSDVLFRYDALQMILPTLSLGWQMAIFLPIFIAFAIKAPMVPVHTWLADTAAAARPGTSTILVGILDKIGTYGMIIITVSFLPAATEAVRPTILVLAVISILWGAFAANGQKNLLRLVSFTSVSHFGFMVLGIYIGSELAMTGAMVYMVAHGLSIAALFLISGFLIQRGGTPEIGGYGGLQRVTPVIAGTWLFAGLASIALPGLSGFVPEYMVLMGTYKVSIPLAIFAVFGVILAAMYILLPYQKMFTGRINPAREDLPDMDGREKFVVAPLIAGMVILGVWSAPLVESMSQISADHQVVYGVEDAGDISGSPAEGFDSTFGLADLNEGNAK